MARLISLKRIGIPLVINDKFSSIIDLSGVNCLVFRKFDSQKNLCCFLKKNWRLSILGTTPRPTLKVLKLLMKMKLFAQN